MEWQGQTPLDIAVALGNPSLVKALLASNKIIVSTAGTMSLRTVLDRAFTSDDHSHEIMELLKPHLTQGTVFELLSMEHRKSRIDRRSEFLQRLISLNMIDVNACRIDGYSILHDAIRFSYWENVEILIQHPQIFLNLVDPQGKTPLCHVVHKKHLFSYRDPTETESEEGEHIPAEDRIISLLLANEGTLPDKPDMHGETPLSKAAEYCHLRIVRMLLATNRVNPNSHDHLGRTPLSKAMQNEESQNYGKEVIEALLSTGKIELQKLDTHEETMMSRAIRAGRKQEVFWLMKILNIDNADKLIANARRESVQRLAEGPYEAARFALSRYDNIGEYQMTPEQRNDKFRLMNRERATKSMLDTVVAVRPRNISVLEPNTLIC